MSKRPKKRHPLAFWGDGESGFYGIKAGDRIRVKGRIAWLDEATHDGDAFITYANGEHDTVRWNAVEPAGS